MSDNKELLYMSIFVDNYQEVRAEHGLGNHNYFPVGFSDYLSLDHECEMLVKAGKLIVLERQNLRAAKDAIRDQEISRAAFQTLAAKIHKPLVRAAIENGMDPATSKVGISMRAGDAFGHVIPAMMPGLKYGFVFQTRDESDPTKTVNDFTKFGDFSDRTRAFLFDPMLATGGSASHVVAESVARGAEEITVISSFSTPEGIVNLFNRGNVDRLITPPIEAGLNERGFIVGGIGATAMLGDFGDRYFG